MKSKVLALSLVMALTLSLTACDKKRASEEAEKVMGVSEESTEGEMHDGDKMEKEGEMMEKMEDKTEEAEETAQASPARFEDYTAAKLAAAKGNQPVAVYFHAGWCSTCGKFKKALESGLSDLPEGSLVLRADYDTETALKKELGVTIQTTVVFFDAEGKKVASEHNPSIDKVKSLLAS